MRTWQPRGRERGELRGGSFLTGPLDAWRAQTSQGRRTCPRCPANTEAWPEGAEDRAQLGTDGRFGWPQGAEKSEVARETVESGEQQPFRPRPKTSRWPKASMFRSGGTATIATAADGMIQMSPLASVQAASWTNQKIMYGFYQRTHSVFQNSEMMAVGKPSADELALLESFRGKAPDEVFGDPFVPPVSDGSGQDRGLLRKASALLQEASFVIKDGKRVTPQGEPISVEFLLDEPSFQPHHMPFIKNLATLGIEANLRIVDPVQYRKRVDDFDFDLTIQRLSFS